MVPTHSLMNTLSFRKVIQDNSFNQFHPIPLTHNDIAFLQYTGGTTGVSKGAILTHANMLSNMQQNELLQFARMPAWKQWLLEPLAYK